MHSIVAVRSKKCMGALAALLMSLMVAVPALAQVKPGDIITPDNAYKVKDLVAQGSTTKSNRACR